MLAIAGRHSQFRPSSAGISAVNRAKAMRSAGLSGELMKRGRLAQRILAAPRKPRGSAVVMLFAAAMLAACADIGDESIGNGFQGRQNAFTWLEPRRIPPRTPIRTAGAPTDLGAFEGEVVVLNFWATWCAPCVEELPTLDRLQAQLGDSGVEVVAVAMDRGGIDTVRSFYDRLGIRHLDIYADPSERTGYFSQENANRAAFPLYGFPITYIIAPDGRAVGYLSGPADWTSPAVKDFLKRLRSPDDNR
jgi:thiol-disulfide isomerase/thioredoxin